MRSLRLATMCWSIWWWTGIDSAGVAVQALQDLVAQCLQADPKARPSACKILKHKFFKVRRDDSSATCCQTRLKRALLRSNELALTAECSIDARPLVSIACTASAMSVELC